MGKNKNFLLILMLFLTACQTQPLNNQTPAKAISSDECKIQGGQQAYFQCPDEKIFLGNIYNVKDVDLICCK